jgi:transcriptional regulator GlxA family with amidase domain
MAATDSTPLIKVLITMHPGMDTMDFVVPLEVLSLARHNVNDDKSKAFKILFCAEDTEHTLSSQGASFRAHMDFEEAESRLDEFDILIIPGGATKTILHPNNLKDNPSVQPLSLIRAYSDLQLKDPKKERTLFAVGTGSIFLAREGILNGLSGTTHPDSYAEFSNACKDGARKDLAEPCDVMEERFVVINLRYDLGNLDENPYIRRKANDPRPSMARKGSNAWKESNTRRESIIRRTEIKLGGLRVITTGGITCAIDASLYLVGIMVNDESTAQIAKTLQYEWKKGTVVDGIDI